MSNQVEGHGGRGRRVHWPGPGGIVQHGKNAQEDQTGSLNHQTAAKIQPKTASHRSRKQMAFAVFEGGPEFLDLSISLLLRDFAVGLKANDQAHAIGEGLEILMEGQPFRAPVFTAIGAVRLQRRVDAG